MNKRFVITLILVAMVAPSNVTAQPAEYKATFHQDLRGLKAMPDNLGRVGDGVRWEAAGARVTVAAGHDRLGTAGISAAFQVKGDFEITTSFEIMKAETPTDGYGVGVSIYAAIDTDTQHSVSLARRVMPGGNMNFVSDRMQPGTDKPEHYVRFTQAKNNVGKLRIQRVGAGVKFLVADGNDGEFEPIFQTPKGTTEKTEFVQFGSSDLRFVQIGADAGTSQAGFDVRFFDFTIKAEELPGLVKSAKPMPPGPSGSGFRPPPSPGEANNPMLMYVLIGVGAVVVVGGGAGSWYYLRRRKTSRPAEAPANPSKPAKTPDAKTKPNKPAAIPDTKEMPKLVDAPIPIVCTNCEKKLRVKAAYAGKRIKCTGCGKPVPVPAPAPKS